MKHLLKRCLDLFVAIPGLVFLSPVILAIAVAVRLVIGSPVFFRQKRPGKNCIPFELIKFRSMTSETDSNGNLLPDDLRLTRLGKFLRRTSLDELPQLWNVATGDLSLVGPRPLLMEYIERYSPEQRRRQEVVPGITGWAQVNGRNALTWEEKFELDLFYVNHWSLLLDFRILCKTLLCIFRRSGVSQQGHATMPVFQGTHKSHS